MAPTTTPPRWIAYAVHGAWLRVAVWDPPAEAAGDELGAALAAWLDGQVFPDGDFRTEAASDDIAPVEITYRRNGPLPVRDLRRRRPVVDTCRICAPVFAAAHPPVDRWCDTCGRQHPARVYAHGIVCDDDT